MKPIFSFPRVLGFAALALLATRVWAEPIPPQPASTPPPEYPYSMRMAGLEGAVLLEFVITASGSVAEVHVVQSNNPWFERPAIDGVMKWRFAPGRVDGRAVNTRVRQEIRFHLLGGGDIPWQVSKAKNHSKLPAELQWDEAPEPVATAFPVYPFSQLRAETKGKTALRFLVDAEGRVYAPAIIEATTPEMGQATLAMIDAWRFKPARKKDGTPCGALLFVEHEYHPFGSADVPVTDGTRRILRRLEKHPEQIVTLRDVDRPPVPLSQRPPVYPSLLREHGEDGQALIEFFIDESGDAQLPHMMSASAPEFGYAAVQAVATWRFEPLLLKGKRVVVRAQIPITFNLSEQKPAVTDRSPAGKEGGR